jgi:hypothetical protein
VKTRPRSHTVAASVPARRSWLRWPVALLLVTIAAAALLAAGCGDDSDDGDKSTASGASADSQAVRYAECMRENGVPNFPDPVTGQLQLQDGADLDPNSPEFQAAQEACQDKLPAGVQDGGAASQETQAQVLKFAKCMRKNGVPDFPDPSVQGGAVLSQTPGIDPNSPQFQAAQQACGDLLSGLRGAP